jgi:hypothetical protein
VGAIQDYVIELLAELLDETPLTEVRFAWALGDPSPRTGRAAQLPFDAVWERRKLIVEIDENQHRKPVKFFDKPDTLTVSGVHRGEQRRLYDARKRAAAREAGYTVMEVPWPRNPPPSRRDRDADRETLRALLHRLGLPEERV